MIYDDLYSLTTYEQYFDMNNNLTVIVSLDKIEIVGIISGNIKSICLTKGYYKNLLNHKPVSFENISLLKKISDIRHTVYIYSTILLSKMIDYKPTIIEYKPTTKDTDFENCDKYNCPFQTIMKLGTYTLADVMDPLPPRINETIGWNKNTYITDIKDVNLYPCATINDLINVIQYSKQNDISLNIRGGGHSYANFTLRKKNILLFTNLFECSDCSNTSIITRPVTNVFYKIRLENGKLHVGNNVRLGEVYLHLHNLKVHNKQSFDFPGGTCGNVGVAGYVLGGGQSYILSHTGPCCHYLYGVRYVNADGVFTSVNEDHHKELMYVIRGGGHIKPFVVTEFIFDLSGLESSLWYFKQINYSFESDKTDTIKDLLNYINNNLKSQKILGPINIYTNHDNQIDRISVAFLNKDEQISTNESYKDFKKEFPVRDEDIFPDKEGGYSLYELYNRRFWGDDGGTISTMWEWRNDPNTGNSEHYNFTVNRSWSSIIGKNLHLKDPTNIINDSFIGLDHYVYDEGGPYKTNSVYPPYRQFTGWTAQFYTYSDIEYNVNSIESILSNILSNDNEQQYKYPNYPPTYKLSEQKYYNSLDLYFNNSDITKITNIKKKYDPSNLFVSDYNFILDKTE